MGPRGPVPMWAPCANGGREWPGQACWTSPHPSQERKSGSVGKWLSPGNGPKWAAPESHPREGKFNLRQPDLLPRRGLPSRRVSRACEAGHPSSLRPLLTRAFCWGSPSSPLVSGTSAPCCQHPGLLPPATAVYLPGSEEDLLGGHPPDESGELVPGQLAGRLAPEAVQEGGVGTGQIGDGQ